MQVTRKQKLVAAGVAAVAVAGGGAAVAASKFGSPSEESTAVVKDAANRLGVQPSALSDALKKALEDRVDAVGSFHRVYSHDGRRGIEALASAAENLSRARRRRWIQRSASNRNRSDRFIRQSRCFFARRSY